MNAKRNPLSGFVGQFHIQNGLAQGYRGVIQAIFDVSQPLMIPLLSTLFYELYHLPIWKFKSGFLTCYIHRFYIFFVEIRQSLQYVIV